MIDLSLGDKISFYLNQINLIELAGRKNAELKLTNIELKGAEEEKDRLELYLKTTIDERNKLQKDVDQLNTKLQTKEDAIKKLELDLEEKNQKIGRLEGEIQGKDMALKVLKPLAGETIKEFIDPIIEYFKERSAQGKTDKVANASKNATESAKSQQKTSGTAAD